MKRHEEALASYDKAIALKPTSQRRTTTAGLRSTNLNRHEEALASYNKAIALKPDFEFFMKVFGCTQR